MNEREKPIGDQILDLLLDALLERQRQREATATPAGEPRRSPLEGRPQPQPERKPKPAEEATNAPQKADPVLTAPKPAAADLEGETPGVPDPQRSIPDPLPLVDLGRMLSRLFLALIVLVVFINIPYDRFGTSLARAMPDSAALVIRDGLLLKGSGEKVYVLEENQRRWITTLDAFEEYGYRWEEVHVVEDAFLEKFEEGPPIHLLLKCQSSPHIYALEEEKKRWIKDIPTFEAQGYVWEAVRFVSCDRLRQLPDGVPIPEDAGPPPQP